MAIMAISKMATKMMEMPSPTSFNFQKNKATILERSAVAPIATQRIF